MPAILCDQIVGTPAIAFNVLAVGSFYDRNPLILSDDVDACSSAVPVQVKVNQRTSFLDPPSPNTLRDGGREEPDVMAPGVLIHTTDINPTNPRQKFADASGTSFAAPHVAGGIALLLDRAPYLIGKGQAELIRAIIMASARHRIKGDRLLTD